MPTITIVRDHLFESIGRIYTDHEFDELCFEFGVEVDDVATEVIEYTGDGSKQEHTVYMIAIPANRYDLLCLEGFSRALRVFLGTEKSPVFKINDLCVADRITLTVESSTNPIRPFVACCVLRGIKFDPRRYKSFIDLQEKLHQNICRKRSYVAIGTHDLSTLQPPFVYKAALPSDINFVPLTENNGRVFSGKELLDFYREDASVKHLKPYADLIYDATRYPVIVDSNNVVLSLPPVINGKHSRITLATTDVFIECTGTDVTKANIVLDTVVTMFSEYCSNPFTAEPVNILYELDGKQTVTPLLSQRTCDAKVSDINGMIGINITPQRMCELCDQMQLGPAIHLPELGLIRVVVPPTRSDVLHAVDVIEDVAIAFGYNNISLSTPLTQCVGAPLLINHFSDLIRAEVARAGYSEMLTHGLCSTAENFTHLLRPVGPAVSLSNPANVEYEVVRTTLLPGALKTLAYNKALSHKDGIKLFEISDVVLPQNDDAIGCKNARRLVALHSAYSSNFEVIHGLVDRVMTCAQIQPVREYAANSLTAEELADLRRVARPGVAYYVRPCSEPCFFPGMSAEVVLTWQGEGENGKVAGKEDSVVGIMGVVHPLVLQNFEVAYPCSVIELDVDAVMM